MTHSGANDPARPPTEDPDDLAEDLTFRCLEAAAAGEIAVVDELLEAQPPALRTHVQRLLTTLGRVGLREEADPTEVPERLGPFRLEGRLGAGTMGVVYRAQRDGENADLALKLLQPGLLPQRGARLRFRREIAALRELDHPGICPILEDGDVDGVPYLAMPYVPGESLREWFARGMAGAEAARREALLGILVEVGHALHHAHERGFVHRDVKPANVIVRPDGRPVLLDFGLARVEQPGGSALTVSGGVVGTPAYMAPEQIAGRSDVDRRCDVYALGALLYEGLTGRLPHEAPTRESLYRRILTGEIVRPSQVTRGVPKALDVVCLTALERDPARRYRSARDLAADLERVRGGEPPAARLPGPWTRARRWVRRNPLPSGLLLALSAAAVGLVVLAAVVRRSGVHDQARALVGEAFALANTDPLLAEEKALEAYGLDPTVIDSLAALMAARTAPRQEPPLEGHTGPVTHLEFAPDDARLVSTSLDGTGRLWDLESRTALVLDHDGEPPALASFQPGGDLVVTAGSGDGTIRAWDARNGELRWREKVYADGTPIRVLRWSPDGTHLLTGGQGAAHLWSAEAAWRELMAIDGSVTAGAWLDGQRVVVGTDTETATTPVPGVGGRVSLVRVSEAGPGEEIAGHEHGHGIAALYPRPGSSGAVLVIARDPKAHICSPGKEGRWTWKTLPTLTLSDMVDGGWSPDGLHAFTITPSGVINTWDPDGRRVFNTTAIDFVESAVVHHRWPIYAIAGDSGKLALRSYHGRRVWRLREGSRRGRPIVFSSAGSRIATVDVNDAIRIWRFWDPELPILFTGGNVRAADWSVDGRSIVTADGPVGRPAGVLWAWDVATGERIGEPWATDVKVVAMLPDPERHRIVTGHAWGSGGGFNGRVGLVSGSPGRWQEEPTAGPEVLRAAFAIDPLDEGRVLLADSAWRLLVWDPAAATIQQIPVVPPDAGPASPGRMYGCCASPDGATLWAGGTPGVLHRFERQPDGTYLQVREEHLANSITTLKWLPGDAVMVGHSDGSLELRSDRGIPFVGHEGPIRDIDWRRVDRNEGEEGVLVLSADGNGRVRLWQSDGTPVWWFQAHDDVVWCVRFSPDGERFLTASSDGTARIWPVFPRLDTDR